MIEAVIFDLDDTLYPEIAYIRSAFSEVAEVLSRRGVGLSHEILALLEHIHWDIDRDRVFQHAASRLNFDPGWIPGLIHLMRTHRPEIRLPAESRNVLMDLCRRYRLGIVTDGHREVQRRKLRALGLDCYVDAIVVSDEMGRPFWKPDPLPFLTACRALKTVPQRSVFVGDHPRRDILGARQLDMKTVRIRRPDGYFRHRPNLPEAPPDCEISHLGELASVLGALESNSRKRCVRCVAENAA